MEKFHWKTSGRIDLIEELFDDDIVLVHLNGYISPKAQWIKELRSGRFIYKSIDVKEASVTSYGNTVVVVGKAIFNVVIRGSKNTLKLTYTEVYTLKNNVWKLVNLHTCAY
ncbi:MAG: nuclear transport factor 2 family protein [Daejeonella sp.]|uniref:nuclear transport factor 2 family protein n=1 Tax=Daejeonella sp. TaxID=2805397 RepID=UPI003C74A523